MMVPIGVQPEIALPEPPRTIRDLEREILIEGSSEIAATAEETGVLVILEPLNRYLTHFINRVEQGADICRAVGSPAIRTMANFYHMNIEAPDIEPAIEEAGEYIGYVHLADSNRYQPGAGHLDFRAALAALKRIGYDGFMTLECRILGQGKREFLPVRSLTNDPSADYKGKVLAKTAQYIRRLWDEV